MGQNGKKYATQLREPTTALKSDLASKVTFLGLCFFSGLNDILYPPKAEKVKKIWGGVPGEFEGSTLLLIIFPASTQEGFLILEGQFPLKQCPELAQYSQALQMDQR